MGYRSKVIIFVAALTFAACLFPSGNKSAGSAGDDAPFYDSRIADLVTQTKFPEKSAVVLIDRRIHKWSFNETTIEREFAVKILTQEGIELFGDFISDVYNKNLLNYSIEAAVVSPRKERNEVDSDYFKKVEFGRNERQYRVALPGLEIGAIIEVQEKIKTEYAITSGRWNFSCSVPTLRSELVFMVPRGALVYFNFTPKDSKLSPTSEIDNKFEKYTITMEVIPPYIDEPYMPQHNIGNPTVYYHIRQVTIDDYLRYHRIKHDDRFVKWMKEHEIPWELPLVTKNWHEVAEAFAEYFDPETWKESKKAGEYRFILSSIIEDMPVDDTSDIVLSLDRILADFHKKFQSIAYQFFFRNPEEILEYREGNPFELAYVLKRILEEHSIRSSVILASDAAHGLLDERNPDPYKLRRPLLAISGDGKQYWIDPFAPECGVNQLPWEYQGVRALALTANKGYAFITTPLDAAPVNCISRKEHIDIEKNGRLSGHAQITLTGQELLGVRRVVMARENVLDSENASQLIGQLFPDEVILDSTTVESDNKDTLTVSCRYSIDNFGEQSGNFMHLDFSGWFHNPILTAFESESREYEIMFPFPATKKMDLRIGIPPDHTILLQDQNKIIEDEWFSYSRSCYQNGNTVIFKRMFAIKSPKVDSQDYEKAKQDIMKIWKIDKEPIVLKHGS